MKKEALSKLIQVIVAALTALLTTLGVSACSI